MLKRTRNIAIVCGLVAGLSACDGAGPTGATEFEWAGTYNTAEKFGGATGIWQATSTLTISATREVTYRGTLILTPTVTDTGISWSRADGNSTNADFLFQMGSTNDFYFDPSVSGRVFQGRIQYAQQGFLDFRGLAQ